MTRQCNAAMMPKTLADCMQSIQISGRHGTLDCCVSPMCSNHGPRLLIFHSAALTARIIDAIAIARLFTFTNTCFSPNAASQTARIATNMDHKPLSRLPIQDASELPMDLAGHDEANSCPSNQSSCSRIGGQTPISSKYRLYVVAHVLERPYTCHCDRARTEWLILHYWLLISI